MPNTTPQKESEYVKYLSPIGQAGYSCVGCHKSLEPDDKVVDCPDCGGIFCETCVRDGTFEDHDCEEDDDD